MVLTEVVFAAVAIATLAWCLRLRGRVEAATVRHTRLEVQLADTRAQLNEATYKYMSEPEDPRYAFRVGASATEFDELVVGGETVWIHLECMGCEDTLADGSDDPGAPLYWWARIGNACLWIEVPREGEPMVTFDPHYYQLGADE